SGKALFSPLACVHFGRMQTRRNATGTSIERRSTPGIQRRWGDDTKAYGAGHSPKAAGYDPGDEVGSAGGSRSPDMAANLRNCRRDKPKFTGHRYRIGGILDTSQAIPCGSTVLFRPPAQRGLRVAIGT